MIHESLSWAKQAMAAELCGDATLSFEGVSTDTRELKKGQVFFCLLGKNDGHDYAESARQAGAAALVINRAHAELAAVLGGKIPLLIVEDTLRALGDLAHAWRERFSIPVIAITGSNGKTTTKELLQTVLKTKFKVLATSGNFNNLIGVPKTLFNLTGEAEVAVIEMGMNDFGEIARLTEISHPTMGLITNIGAAHLEKLGGLDGVSRAKGELFEGLDAGATAVVNLADSRVAALPTKAKRVGYGIQGSVVWGKVLSDQMRAGYPLELQVQVGGETSILSLKLPGAHNLQNVMASLAIGDLLGVNFSAAKRALESFEPAPSRMQIVSLPSGITLLDDCYNANPSSTVAALATLGKLQSGGRSLAIVGDMLELGDHAVEGHRQVGQAAGNAGIDFLLAVGPHAQEIVAGAKDAGSAAKLSAFPDTEGLLQALQKLPNGVKWILVKGSRGMHLEKVVQHLKEHF